MSNLEGAPIRSMIVVAATLKLAGGAATAQQVSPDGLMALSPARITKPDRNLEYEFSDLVSQEPPASRG